MERPLLILAGGTGFLGRHIRHYFTKAGYRVLTLSRRATGPDELAWDGRTLGPWAAALEGAAVVLNLTGRSVDCRYHAVNRYAILRSRTDSTRVLGVAIAACRNPPALWLNSSTATIYEDTTGAAPVLPVQHQPIRRPPAGSGVGFRRWWRSNGKRNST